MRREVDAGSLRGSPIRCACRSATVSACTARRRPPSSPRCWGSRAARRATTSANSRSTASSRRTPPAAADASGSGVRVPGGLQIDSTKFIDSPATTRRGDVGGERVPAVPAGPRRALAPHLRAMATRSGPSTAPRDRSTSSSPPRRWASSARSSIASCRRGSTASASARPAAVPGATSTWRCRSSRSASRPAPTPDRPAPKCESARTENRTPDSQIPGRRAQ